MPESRTRLSQHLQRLALLPVTFFWSGMTMGDEPLADFGSGQTEFELFAPVGEPDDVAIPLVPTDETGTSVTPTI